MQLLRWTRIAPRGEAYHVARVPMRGRNACRVHTHDFAEVFWVERGSGVQVINDQRLPLQPGTLVLIRAADRHGFHADQAAGFVLVNVAFPVDSVRFIRRRLGLTPTDIVNRARLDYAARQLPVTTQKIIEIALECGFHNLSHFHLVSWQQNSAGWWGEGEIKMFQKGPAGDDAMSRLAQRRPVPGVAARSRVVVYWYQTLPHAPFPAFPDRDAREII